VPPEKPIVGSAAFRHETGIHCAGLLRDPRSYEPFAPEAVGRVRADFVLGAKTGGAAVAAVARAQGRELAPTTARTLAAQVRALARQRHAPVTIADLWALAGEPI